MLEYIRHKRLNFFTMLQMSILFIRDNFMDLVFVMLAVAFPISILKALVNNGLSVAYYSLQSLLDVSSEILSEADALQVLDYTKNVLYYAGLDTLINISLLCVAEAAVIRMCRNWLLQKKEDPRTALKESLVLEGKMLVTGLVFVLLSFLGYSFFIIPGILVAVYFRFYLDIIVLEEAGTTAALKKSYHLVKGRFLETLLFYLGAWFIYIGFSNALSWLTYIGEYSLIKQIIYFTLYFLPLCIPISAMAFLCMNRDAHNGGHMLDDIIEVQAQEIPEDDAQR